MIVPRIKKVLKVESIVDKFKPDNEIHLIKSLRGVPVLKLEDSGSTYLYVFSGGGVLTAKAVSTTMKELSLGDIAIKVKGKEVIIRSGKGEFHGVGFLKLFETSVYYLSCRQNTCLAGISDLVDDIVKLYQLKIDGLRPSDIEAANVSSCHGCFSVGNKLFTLYVSTYTAGVMPGSFKLLASCSDGDYLIDKDGFLVRVRKGLFDVLGKFNDAVAAACLSYGLVVADGEGLKIVKYGAYTTISRDTIYDLSSHQDVITAVSRSGLVKILTNENFYTLDSPLLKTCKATSEGVVCLAENYVILLDPYSPKRVETELREISSNKEIGLFELIVTPWYESCRYSIMPRIIEILGRDYKDDVLYLTLYPRVPRWEGRIKLQVECPTHHSLVEEYIRSGGVTLEEILEKQVVIVEPGKLVGSENHNCAGNVLLGINSLYPLPLHLEVKIYGLENPVVTLSQDRILPGRSKVSIRFSGKYVDREKLIIELYAGLDPAELEQIATIYIEPEYVFRIKPCLNDDLRVTSSDTSTTIVLPESYLKLYCSNGAVIEGFSSIRVENCEEPALLQAVKNIEINGFVFESTMFKIFRDATEECIRSPVSEKIVKGGFYVNCGSLKTSANCPILAKVEYSNSYRLSLYVGSSKILEKELEDRHLITGLIADVSRASVLVSWRNIIELSTRLALIVGGILGEVIYGKRNIRS